MEKSEEEDEEIEEEKKKRKRGVGGGVKDGRGGIEGKGEKEGKCYLFRLFHHCPPTLLHQQVALLPAVGPSPDRRTEC